MISAAKVISTLHLVFILVASTSNAFFDPIQFYESAVDDHALFGQIPGPVMAAMLHMAVAVYLVFVLCAITIFVTTWNFEASKIAMCMGVVFWTTIAPVSHAIVPHPSVMVLLGIQLPESTDAIPFVFGGIFLFGFIAAAAAAWKSKSNLHSKSETSASDGAAPTIISKLWSIGYLLILVKVSCFWTALLDQPSFLIPSVSTEDWEATPIDVQMVISRAIFCFCALHLCAAVGTLIAVVILNRQKATYMFAFSMYFWMIRLVYIHLAYPWPNKVLKVESTEDMFIEGAIVLGSLASLLAELILGTLAARAREADNRRKTKRD